jgi:hypothetical protein
VWLVVWFLVALAWLLLAMCPKTKNSLVLFCFFSLSKHLFGYIYLSISLGTGKRAAKFFFSFSLSPFCLGRRARDIGRRLFEAWMGTPREIVTVDTTEDLCSTVLTFSGTKVCCLAFAPFHTTVCEVVYSWALFLRGEVIISTAATDHRTSRNKKGGGRLSVLFLSTQ